MISIGGVIGAGLFVGSGAVVHSAGYGSIVSYALAGLLVIFVMRMLGKWQLLIRQVVHLQHMQEKQLIMGRLYNWVAILVFLGNCYCNRSYSRCWYYSILDSGNPTLVIKLNINDFINVDECFLGEIIWRI